MFSMQRGRRNNVLSWARAQWTQWWNWKGLCIRHDIARWWISSIGADLVRCDQQFMRRLLVLPQICPIWFQKFHRRHLRDLRHHNIALPLTFWSHDFSAAFCSSWRKLDCLASILCRFRVLFWHEEFGYVWLAASYCISALVVEKVLQILIVQIYVFQFHWILLNSISYLLVAKRRWSCHALIVKVIRRWLVKVLDCLFQVRKFLCLDVFDFSPVLLLSVIGKDDLLLPPCFLLFQFLELFLRNDALNSIFELVVIKVIGLEVCQVVLKFEAAVLHHVVLVVGCQML